MVGRIASQSSEDRLAITEARGDIDDEEEEDEEEEEDTTDAEQSLRS